MLIIKDTIKSMNATLDDAKKYARLALQCKGEYPELAAIYYNTAKSHVDTYNDLHKQIVKFIETYRKDKGEPPTEMQIIWQWEHEQEIECMNEIKRLLDQYKE